MSGVLGSREAQFFGQSRGSCTSKLGEAGGFFWAEAAGNHYEFSMDFFASWVKLVPGEDIYMQNVQGSHREGGVQMEYQEAGSILVPFDLASFWCKLSESSDTMGVFVTLFVNKNGRLIEFYLKKETEGPWTSLSKKKLPWVKVLWGHQWSLAFVVPSFLGGDGRWTGKDGKTPMMRKKEKTINSIWTAWLPDLHQPFSHQDTTIVNQTSPGHFWLLVWLLVIATSTGGSIMQCANRFPKNSTLSGLGDMNFGDMAAGEEYDSDDEAPA